jgi:CBS domain-containing protein
MRARDLMTTTVLTVSPETPIADVAALLASRGISAVPVLDAEGKMVGIVTEADLVRRVAGEAARRKVGWFGALFAAGARDDAASYARQHGDRAADVMSADVVTVDEDTPAAEIARIMEQRGVKRLPVLRRGRLAGVVSRADLLGLALATPKPVVEQMSDERIRRSVEAAMREQPWADAYLVYPAVAAGIVTFHGYCRSPAVQNALRILAEAVPGVKGVTMKVVPPPPFLLGVP